MCELAAATGDAGGKAAGLARLRAAGLPVPDGFALTAAAFEAVTGAAAAGAPGLDDVGATLARWAEAALHAPLPLALEAAVVARARALGGPLIVRSSMALEDGARAAAPGVGRSIGPLAPDDVWPAVRAVWAASLTPLVARYARAAGEGARALAAPGVVVQRWLPGARLVVYTRPPGRPDADEAWLGAGEGAPRRTPRDAAEPAVALALAAERALAATAGADVELVADGAGGWAVVQARPLVHPPPRARPRPPPPLVLAPLQASGRAWRRDVAHNPDPLSPAQAGLCELVERAAIAPFPLAVAAGFLYAAPRDGVAVTPAPATAAELEARFAAGADAIARALAVGDALEPALAAYLAAYRVLAAELGPLVTAARAVLVERLVADGLAPAAAVARAAALAPHRPSSLVAAVARAARGELDRADLLALVGELAPVWDVASPTFAEAPAALDAAVVRAGGRSPPPIPPSPPHLAREVALARAAAELAERDDLLFARAQAVVRRALLAAGRALGLAEASDVCWLPLDEVRARVAEPGDDEALATWRARVPGRAAAARTAAARAAAWAMPLTLGAAAPSPGATSWAGSGLGGRVAGPVARIDHLADAGPVAAGAIVVARAVTPALALLVEGARALVCEHGSLLDHGAAMARELGLPCVVGCAGIVDDVVDGEWLEVDGDAGLARRV